MLRLMCGCWTLLAAVGLGASWGRADDGAGDWQHMHAITPHGYVCARASNPLNIDGKLGESAWQAAGWTQTFVDIEGDKRPEPRMTTKVKMLWDDQYFYVAAELAEPNLWATITERDAVIFQDNDFEMFIDPDGDNHQYYELEINALNTVWDLYLPKPYKDGGSADNSWNIDGLKSAVSLEGTLNDPADVDRSWTVELAIPWTAFQPPKLSRLALQKNESLRPRPGQTWRVDFSRVEWQLDVSEGKYRKVPNTKEDNWVWSPQGIVDMHRPERWGYVQFVSPAADGSSPNQSSLVTDPALPVRDQLMNVYHRQKVFHQRNGRWATELQQLAIDTPGLTLEATPEGFTASASLSQEGVSQQWFIRQDSRLRSSPYYSQVEQALKLAGPNAEQLRLALDSVTARQREGLEFLIANMPEPDLKTLGADFLIENVREAYETLEASPWGDTIPKEIFFNNVLPYASINERRDNWRKDFKKRFSHLIKEAKTPGQAAALLNQRLYPLLNVKYSTQRKKADQSPYESMSSGLASCTGLSVLLIDACRAVGVPARFVGTPLWTDNSGNHSWTEVWDNGWHFTGSAEPNGDELDKAWFIDRASKAKRDEPMNAIYAVSYAKTPLKFPMVWAKDADYICAVNVTDRYTQLATKPPEGTTKVMFKVLEPSGQRVTATLVVSDPDSSQTWEATSNDERFDSNDHVGLYLPSSKHLRIQATYQQLGASHEFDVNDSDVTITLQLKPQ